MIQLQFSQQQDKQKYYFEQRSRDNFFICINNFCVLFDHSQKGKNKEFHAIQHAVNFGKTIAQKAKAFQSPVSFNLITIQLPQHEYYLSNESPFVHPQNSVEYVFNM
ncbi:hypothetical protein ABPG72_020568 [Tetrahymena utriculariae]